MLRTHVQLRLSGAVCLTVAVLLGSCGQHGPQAMPQVSTTVPARTGMSSTTTGCDSSINANFNGTPIAAGNTLWFSAVMKVTGVGSSPVTLGMTQSTITFTASGTPYTVTVPQSSIKVTPGSTTATITSSGGWTETVPYPFSGNVLVNAVELPITSALPGGIQNVAWNGHFTTSQTGVSVNWQWGAAVYKQFSTDYNALGVKPVDANNTSQYPNSDHAGTPENYKAYVTGGATGGGGSNYTGGLSGTAAVVPCINKFGYANNFDGGTLDVIDFASNSIVKTIAVGTHPWGVAVRPQGDVAYVAIFDSSTIAVVDLSTDAVVNTIAEPSGSGPTRIVFSPDGSKAYVANYTAQTVGVINAATQTLTATIPNMGARPVGVAISPNGANLYVMPNDATLKVVDTSSNALVADIPLGNPCCFGGNGVTANQTGTRVYVAGSFAEGVAEVDTSSNTVARTFAVGQPIGGTNFSPTTDWVTLNPAGNALYAGAYDSNEITTFDVTIGTATSVNAIGGTPIFGSGLSTGAFSADGSTLYVGTSGTIDVLNATTFALIATIPVGGEVDNIILPRN